MNEYTNNPPKSETEKPKKVLRWEHIIQAEFENDTPTELKIYEVAENAFKFMLIKIWRTEFRATPISKDKASRDEFQDTEPRWNLNGVFTNSELNNFSPKEKRGGTIKQITNFSVKSNFRQDIPIYTVDIDVPWKTVARYTGRFFRKGYDTKTNSKHTPLQFTPLTNSQGESVFILPEKRKKSSNPRESAKEKIEIFLN